VTRHPDPLYRRHFLYVRAQARVKRRVAAVLAFIDLHPDCTRGNCATLRRLDDLLGEAGALRGALT
jgi:hypothetical protein